MTKNASEFISEYFKGTTTKAFYIALAGYIASILVLCHLSACYGI